MNPGLGLLLCLLSAALQLGAGAQFNGATGRMSSSTSVGAALSQGFMRTGWWSAR
jgi:hypothetical protein